MTATIVIESDVALWMLGGLVVPVFAAWLQNTRRAARIDATLEAMSVKVENVDNAVNHGRMERVENAVMATQVTLGTLTEHVEDMRGAGREQTRHMFAIGVAGSENETRLDALATQIVDHGKRITRLEVVAAKG